MARLDDIKSALDDIAAARGFHEGTEEGLYHRLSLQMDQAEEEVRRQIEAETADEIRAVIGRLEADDEITAGDLELIRVWMVSDAEFYVQMENDYRNWLAELDRLVGVVDDLRRREPTRENLGRISGTLRDALRVVADITYFKQEQQRIRSFENATRRLYPEDKRTLARILRQKLRRG